jgi:hypothetical protein
VSHSSALVESEREWEARASRTRSPDCPGCKQPCGALHLRPVTSVCVGDRAPLGPWAVRHPVVSDPTLF